MFPRHVLRHEGVDVRGLELGALLRAEKERVTCSIIAYHVIVVRDSRSYQVIFAGFGSLSRWTARSTSGVNQLKARMPSGLMPSLR